MYDGVNYYESGRCRQFNPPKIIATLTVYFPTARKKGWWDNAKNRGAVGENCHQMEVLLTVLFSIFQPIPSKPIFLPSRGQKTKYPLSGATVKH